MSSIEALLNFKSRSVGNVRVTSGNTQSSHSFLSNLPRARVVLCLPEELNTPEVLIHSRRTSHEPAKPCNRSARALEVSFSNCRTPFDSAGHSFVSMGIFLAVFGFFRPKGRSKSPSYAEPRHRRRPFAVVKASRGNQGSDHALREDLYSQKGSNIWPRDPQA